ncbi:MAG TPA: LCP family protein [Capsulimonadaceae bacterium]|nr:LCP family protein [Capsulimonadaceae bacterium]
MSNPAQNTPSSPYPKPRPTPRRSPWKIVVLALCLVILGGLAIIGGKLLKAVRPVHGEKSGAGPTNIVEAVSDIWQIAGDPRAGFPGMSRVNILCMGIDDNWTNGDEVYTHNARTDTLFLLSLDLDSKTASVLSIPRDSFVHIAGTDYSDKINSAYASGGPARAEATVADLLGVRPDYYIVLNIDATKKMVDALGGVDLTVEHEMIYDDNWGHLHVHLEPGLQHLDGDQAVGFARFRHGNHGLTPEDGDPRRIYRQHVLLKAMMQKAKSFSSITQFNSLIDTGMSCIATDLTRTQLADLGRLYYNMPPDDLVTAQLPGEDFRGPNGAADTKLDDDKAKLYVQWLIQGDSNAARALTPVVVENGTKTSGVAQKAVVALRSYGYTNVRVGNTSDVGAPRTDIVDSGVAYQAGAQEIASFLGIAGATVVRRPVEPNHAGWAPPASVTVILGKDYASAEQTASGNLTGPSISTTP